MARDPNRDYSMTGLSPDLDRSSILNDLPPATTLYHYTSITAAHSILTSNELHASSLFHANDSMEFHLGLELFFSRIELFLQKDLTNDDRNALIHFSEELHRNEERYLSMDICSVSFTERGNLLSQWRGYASDGPGLSLGFKANILPLLADQVGFEWVKVRYTSAEHNELIDRQLDRVIEVSKLQARRVHSHEYPVLDEAIRICAAIKDLGFAEEQEWRLVSDAVPLGRPALAFKPGGFGLLPYFKVPIIYDTSDSSGPGIRSGMLPLADVFLGPNKNPAVAKRTLSNFLMRIGHGSPVQYCDISLRV